MGSIARKECNHAEINWTPLMERCLIDLLLDEIRRGNRVGNTLMRQSWTDIQALFSAQFGLRCDMTFFKYQWGNLWKQFNDVKNLLDQNGFSWDEGQLMVIAGDDDWDAYIKGHPDAQYYRNRSLMSFNDLCLIFAYTAADGRYSRSSHDIDYDDETQGMMMDSPFPTIHDCTKKVWTPNMDQYFIMLMLDQVNKGNKIENTYTQQAWKSMLASFNAKFSSRYGKNFLRRRFKKLLKYYVHMKSLLEEKGVSGNDSTQSIEAIGDVWDKYIRARPDALLYRNKTWLKFQDLASIYGSASSTGSGNCFKPGKKEGRFASKKGLKANMDQVHKRGSMPSSHKVAFICNYGQESVGEPDFHHYVKCERDDPVEMAGTDKVEFTAIMDYSETTWMPLMDRYLIDLMLEHVRRGNKKGHVFNIEAWRDMVLSFKERFGSVYDTDFLQCRYEYLRRQYHAMRKHLQQRGSCLDESQQLNVACGDFWDGYIKENPDVKSCRKNPGPDYHELCLIYGTSVPGDICQLDSDTSPYGSGHCCSWTYPMDRLLIDLLLELVRASGPIRCDLGEQAWQDIIAKFEAEFGWQFSLDVLRSRFLDLKRQFLKKTGLDQYGSLWDDRHCKFAANDFLCIPDLKEEHDLQSDHSRSPPYCEDLFLIFGNADVIDCSVETSDYNQGGSGSMDLPGDIDMGECDSLNETDSVIGDSNSPAAERNVSARKKRKSGPAVNSCHIANIRKLDGQLDSRILNRQFSEVDRACCTVENIVDALQSVPGIDDEIVLEALELLEDERKAKMFIAMDATARSKWLSKKLQHM